MELESIAVICLITLAVLIIQIIVTLRLLLYFHHRSHEKDEEHGIRTIATGPAIVPAQEDAQPALRNDVEAFTLPGPAYPASSRYSVQTGISDISSHYGTYTHGPWHRAEASTQKREVQVSHSNSETENGNSFADNALSKTKKEGILDKVWGKKP
jgi:hypothetical protein